ncbi:hypothetical protein EDC47_11921 [Raoultella planticola]|nr:hypothetical protein [Raoultella planticola]TCL45548.1 hypothetical protein EDC47_11921 [Raoultella planticola]SPZ32208.1 Uncharacterised protein [Raoultella planticola]
MPPNGVISAFATTSNASFRDRFGVDSRHPPATGVREQPQARPADPEME